MARLSKAALLLGVSALLVAVAAGASGTGIGVTSIDLVSASMTGGVGDNFSDAPSLSADGRYAAFNSAATNLVSGDTNGASDDFVRDTQTATTTRVSVASDGTQGNGNSGRVVMSGDGRYVAFESSATNLVPGDTNGTGDVFVHDMQTGVTTRVSVASDGTQASALSFYVSISADGRYVAFGSGATNLASGTNGVFDVYVHDMTTGKTTLVSVASDGTPGNGESDEPQISADGRYVAFESSATNLVSGDTNGHDDIFVHDMQTGVTTRVSVASDGTEQNGDSYQPMISADGSYVGFESDSTNLVSGDTNGAEDVFVHDMRTGATTRVSVASDGTQGNGDSGEPSISADGRFVAFDSVATNLVDGDTNGAEDVFVHDMLSGRTTRVSVTPDGTEADNASVMAAIEQPTITPDGSSVAFGSLADNLVTGDNNANYDAFVARLSLPPSTLTVSKSGSGSGGVTSSPTGINCGTTCSHAYDHGTMVTLTAAADPGSSFAGWSGGGCSGTGTCTVTMDDDTAVTAAFNVVSGPAAPPPTTTLTIAMGGTGAGTVTSTNGISCGTSCSSTLQQGTSLTLTATARAGSAFLGWGGDCSGTGPCTLTMDTDHTVTATFGGVTKTLTVATSSGGAVTSNPVGISCGSSCSQQYAYGTVVTLTASAQPGWSFAGWSGDCSGTGACTTTMDADHTVGARFQALVRCVVPNVKGETLGQAGRTLGRAHCVTGTIRHAHSGTVAKGRVVSQQPTPGTTLPKNGKVNLVVSRGK